MVSNLEIAGWTLLFDFYVAANVARFSLPSRRMMLPTPWSLLDETVQSKSGCEANTLNVVLNLAKLCKGTKLLRE